MTRTRWLTATALAAALVALVLYTAPRTWPFDCPADTAECL